MQLETQLDLLARAGITLSPDATIDDLLYSFDRGAYESRPFHLLSFVLGVEVEREPWGRPFSRSAWNFDTECVHGPGAYVEIVRRLAALAGRSDALGAVTDHLDFDTGEAWLAFELDGRTQRWTVEVRDDWADTLVVSYVMAALERDGKRFYARDNGQAMVLYFLDAAAAGAVNAVAPDLLRPVVP